MHYDILDNERKQLLPVFAKLDAYDFYLAGGTALALQLGHRDSIDFDFFTEQTIDTEALAADIERHCVGQSIVKVQESKNTLGIVIDNTIKASFMTYSYPLVKPLVETEYFPLASLADIACMKCSAITSRGVMKDYIDLYFILQTLPIGELLELCTEKYPSIDTNLIAKSLVYFDDLEPEAIIYKGGHETDFETVKNFLRKQATGL